MTWSISIVRNQSLTLRRQLRPEVSFDDEIGIETADDIIADLDQALAKAAGKAKRQAAE